ncbi:aminodeoxychorismate synthase component I [Idiomarina sp. PL1-037]|uniref:aminodeoxychorismate synthase component I n=1 Tax=Idiomarina sp. PL1-037 TaxID=3095365 RepID=UPI002ACBF178|nr:aminodeoxychorismate synthase component I [Idiomarina sp. PL1-037]WQC52139.1 aminodeoxychorismate synthase component I [Idiomarina sp. PL1-037]
MSVFPDLCAIELNCQASAIELFQRCQHESYALLLDSAAQSHENCAYDIIFRQPELVLSCKAGNLKVSADNPSKLPPLPDSAAELCRYAEQLNQLSGRYSGPAELPFQGGFAGAVGYDHGRSLEVIPEFNADTYQSPDAILAYYSQALIIDRQSDTVWLVAPVGRSDELRAFWEQQVATKKPDTFQLLSDWQSNMSEQQYIGKFNAVQNYLLAGDTYQINLAQRYSASYQGSEWSAYLKLRHANSAPFSAFMRLPGSAILSLSPERFLLTDAKGQVETKPIKGTRPRFDDTHKDQASQQTLLSSEKDRAENLMIVDLLRNDLSKNCEPGSIKTPSLFTIESFPAVHHLVSTVVGKLQPGRTALSLFNGAFPGGSITGAPKIRAMQIIEELEPNRRNIYCGSMGYFSQHGRSDTSITIRTLLAEDGQLHCWAGGGLVADSTAAEEYQETKDKVSRILPVLTS